MDNRRLFLAALLSFIVVLLWTRFVQPPPVAPRPDAPLRATQQEPTDDRTVPPSTTAGTGGAAGVSPSGSTGEPGADGSAEGAAAAELPDVVAAAELPDVVAAAAESVVVENARYRAELTNRGAQLVSFRLRAQRTADGEQVDMVRRRGHEPYPFGLRRGEDPHPLNDALFTVERSPLEGGVDEVRFAYRGPAGAAEKRFRFQPNGLVEVSVTVPGEDGWSVVFGPGVRNPSAEEMGDRLTQRMASYLRGGDEEKLLPTKQHEVVTVPAPSLQWATLEDNYFLGAVVPSSGLGAIEIRPVRQLGEVEGDQARFHPPRPDDEGSLAEQELALFPSGDRLEVITYLGAKRYSHLTDLPFGLERTVRWGFFGFVARPMYYGLIWIHERIPNYGWAIVLMTMLIKLIFFPLTHKSQKSMAKMQEINPKVQALRNRYRSKLKDKQGRPNVEAQRQMNEEMMALYRQAGVNPASGCLPVLLQIPVFFAFFRLLSTAIELRGAPWLGWIADLSIPDPWYLLPAVMLITSILLQRMTPPPPDPVQRRLMQLFPFMFGIFAIAFPAGLVLYWTTNNILTMGQQAFYLRSKKKQEASAG